MGRHADTPIFEEGEPRRTPLRIMMLPVTGAAIMLVVIVNSMVSGSAETITEADRTITVQTPGPTITETVPGPTVTINRTVPVPQPAPAVTVRTPGPTVTITTPGQEIMKLVPAPTVTITKTVPGPTITVTEQPVIVCYSRRCATPSP